MAATGNPQARALVYVDATRGPSGNTVRASDGSVSGWFAEPGTNTDGLWGQRAYAHGGTVFEASGAGGAENAPLLRTTLTGLVPGATYRLYARYWSALDADWTFQAGSSSTALQFFDRTASGGAQAGTAVAINFDMGGTASLHDHLGGPAYASSSGTGVLSDAHDLWNAVTNTDLPIDTVLHTDGTLATGVSLNVGRQNGAGSTVVDWSLTDLTNRGGASPEGLQDNGSGAFASLVMQTYERDNAADTTIRFPAFAVENLPQGEYDVYVVADNTYHTAAAGTNRSYRLYCGVGETSSGTTSFAGFTTQVVTNTDWTSWQSGVNYAKFHVAVTTAGQDIVILSEETASLDNHSLINAVQIVSVEANRVELKADLGELTADASGQISVFVDDKPASNGNDRSWYDGLSYEEAVVELAPDFVVLNDNGGWCWYQDQRALIHDGTLLAGSVANSAGTDGASRGGNIELSSYNIAAGGPPMITVLHQNLQNDDHDLAALFVRPDDRLLTVFAKHGSDALIRYRIATSPGDTTTFDPEQTVTRSANVTYSNVFRLSAENNGNGRLYDFYRGEGFDPNFVISDNDGATWAYGGRLLYNATNDSGMRPYLKYASNGVDTVHFINTEAHPQDWSGYTSIYHGYIRDGKVYHSNGTLIADLQSGPIEAASPTRVFQGSSTAGEGWTASMYLDSAGRPYIGFSVHLSDNDHRYHYARWDGAAWQDHEIAYAGTRLYAGQNHYTGLIALDPQDPDRVFISTNADPVTGTSLVSAVDHKRHWELYRGVTSDFGTTWTWTPLTQNSTVDNLRPIVPVSDGGYAALLWMRGTYTSYTNYDLDVVGQVFVAADFDMDGDVDQDDLDAFVGCTTGPLVPYAATGLPAGCTLEGGVANGTPADLDHDGDVDQSDFGILQACFSGDAAPPDMACTR